MAEAGGCFCARRYWFATGVNLLSEVCGWSERFGHACAGVVWVAYNVCMAYLNIIAAVDAEAVAEFRAEARELIRPSRAVSVSHLIGSPGWNDFQPLQSILAEVLDGGELLSQSLWHPLRPPVYHSPGRVAELCTSLTTAWKDLLSDGRLSDDDSGRIEISRAVDIVRHAADAQEGLVSILQPPFDRERAEQQYRIRCS